MLHVAKPAPESVQISPEVSAGLTGAMPSVEIGVDAGPTRASERQFKGGAAVGSEPTVIVELDSNPQVTGVLAKISPNVTVKQTAPGEDAALSAIDAGSASDTYLFVNYYNGRPLADHIKNELAA